MGNSICKFIPTKNYNKDLKTINFVYESELKKLKQPFIKPIFVMNLVIKGKGILKANNTESELNSGTVFFNFPGYPFELSGSDDFRYIYISFMGTNAANLLNDFGINPQNSIYSEMDFVIPFWLDSIRRINQQNANVLTESVLLYTLSFLNNEKKELILKKNNENLFELIVDYIDNHYMDSDISIKKIADVFSYTEKYISSLFCKNMKIKFKSYLSDLRIQYANKLIEDGETSVSKIAESCGYQDSLYFSKVYKQSTGKTPREKIKSR